MRRSLPPQKKLIAIAAITLGVLAPAIGSAGPPGATTLVCTNPASGTTWKINIDFAKSTVDSNAAHISDSSVSWYDPTDMGNYSLDRKSGKLNVAIASSTGGYILFDRCDIGPLQPKS